MWNCPDEAESMKRLVRYTLNTLAALSLLMCVATVVLWVRSYSVQDSFSGIHGEMIGDDAYHRVSYEGHSVQGVNVLQIHAADYRKPFGGEQMFKEDVDSGFTKVSWRHVSPRQFSFNYNPDVRNRPLLYRLGFRFSHSMIDASPSPGYSEARIPDWFLAVITAILPAIFLWRVYRNRREIRAGLCASCGYDLRATPDRCPECGTIPTKAKAAGISN